MTAESKDGNDRCDLCGDPAGEGQRTADLILCEGCSDDLRRDDPLRPDLGGDG